MERNQLTRFATDLERQGAQGAGSDTFCLGRQKFYSLHYTPFEYVNTQARLVLVGITPGITQLQMSYEAAQTLIRQGLTLDDIAREVKKHGAFGGKSMRPNLLRILRHFQFERLLGIDDVETLWSSNAELIHSTSVVPHAAFKLSKGTPKNFAGSFDEIRKTKLLNDCFLDCFVPSVKEMSGQAQFVGLGPTPLAALKWCVERGLISRSQVLGAFCHPSTTGGSTVGYYLREVPASELKPKNPVLNRIKWLDGAYEQMRTSVAAHSR